jgi:hypothetical protein
MAGLLSISRAAATIRRAGFGRLNHADPVAPPGGPRERYCGGMDPAGGTQRGYRVSDGCPAA